MKLEEYLQIKDKFREELEQLFLKLEEENPGFLKEWLRMWSEGPVTDEE